MKNLKAFLAGISEFRSSITTAYDTYVEADYYDMGRELAHKLTLRLFEPS